MTFSYTYLKCWSQGKVKFIISHSTLDSCCVHLRTFFRQPFSEQLYINLCTGEFAEQAILSLTQEPSLSEGLHNLLIPEGSVRANPGVTKYN